MKRSLATITLFVVSALAFACGGRGQTNSNTQENANAGSSSTAFQYPPVSSGLALAEYELLDGSKMKLADRRGKVVLLTLWGTWCGPCIAEMPALIALQDRYGDKGFEIIGLNVGDGSGTPEPVDLITRFVAEKKLNYTIARSSNESTREFYKVTKADVIPQSLLVDREGRLRGMFIGGGARITAQLEENIAKVMAE